MAQLARRSFSHQAMRSTAAWLVTLAFALLLAACGGGGGGSDPEPNRAPVAVAGPPQSVTVGTAVTLDGSASHDPDGQALGFAWRISAAPAGSTVALDNTGAARPVFTPDLPGSYTLSLVVGDGMLDSAAATTIVNAIAAPPPDPDPVNGAPTAVAGPAQSVTVGTPVTLDGSASHDPEGHALGFAWRIAAAPAGSSATLNDPALARPVFTPDLPGSYTLSLVVSDGMLDSAAATTTVTATDPPDPGPPVAIVLDQPEPVSGVVVFTLSRPHPGLVSWYVDLQLLGPPEGSQAAEMAWDSATATVGPHLVSAHLLDGQGGWQEVRRTFDVGPGPITMQTRVVGTSGRIAVDVGARSPHGIYSVAATLDGQALGTLTEPNGCGPQVVAGTGCLLPYQGWLFTLDAAAIGPGLHTMRITATDNAGRTLTQEQAVQVGPVVTLALPLRESIVYGSLSVAGSVQAVPPAAAVTVFIGSTPILATTSPDFAASYDLAGVAPGPQRVLVRATDAAGLVTELERYIVVAAAPEQVHTPLYLPEVCQSAVVVDTTAMCYSTVSNSTLLLRDLTLPLDDPTWTTLDIGAPATGFSERTLSDDGLQAIGPGDDCIGSCVYRWNRAGVRSNLSALAPGAAPGDRHDSFGLKARGGHLLWHEGSTIGSSHHLVLYDVAQARHTLITPAGISIGTVSDFVVHEDGVVRVYFTSSGSSNDVYEWRSDTQAVRRLTEGDGRWEHSKVKTDGRRVAWLRWSPYQAPHLPPDNRTELAAMTLDSGAVETLVSLAERTDVYFTLADGVLIWSNGGLKASAGGAIHTSPINSNVLANGLGVVALADNQGLYTWNPVTGELVQRFTVGLPSLPGSIVLTGGHLVFVYRHSALYRLPLP